MVPSVSSVSTLLPAGHLLHIGVDWFVVEETVTVAIISVEIRSRCVGEPPEE